MSETVDKLHYLSQLDYAALQVQYVVFVGDNGIRVRVPLLTAVASSSLLATALDCTCSCINDVVVIIPDISAKSLDTFVHFITGKSVCGGRDDMLELEKLCYLFGIRVQLGIEPTEEGVLVDSTAQHQTLKFPQCTVMDKDVAQDIEEVYVKEEIDDSLHLTTAHESGGIWDDHSTCKTCHKRFLRQQLERHECIASTLQNVSQDGEESQSSNDLDHEVIFKFKCKYCDKGFKNVSHLERHELTHTGVKPFHCKYCNKSFSCTNNVVTHERIHTGEKPFKCKFCNRGFTRQSHCKTHEFIHTGDKPHKCKYCDKSFRSYATLHKHILLHTGERPFTCAYCNKGFVRGDRCRRHEKLHTRENRM